MKELSWIMGFSVSDQWWWANNTCKVTHLKSLLERERAKRKVPLKLPGYLGSLKWMILGLLLKDRGKGSMSLALSHWDWADIQPASLH